jgi:copper chaperone CopZ
MSRQLAAIGILATILLVTGCTRPRAVLFTYFKMDVTPIALNDDLKAIKRAAGVQKVTSSLDSSNKAIIEVFVEEDKPFSLQERMIDLGYTRVRD